MQVVEVFVGKYFWRRARCWYLKYSPSEDVEGSREGMLGKNRNAAFGLTDILLSGVIKIKKNRGPRAAAPANDVDRMRSGGPTQQSGTRCSNENVAK